MIGRTCRALSFVLLLAAFAAAVVDGTRSIAAGRVSTFSLADTVGWLAQTVPIAPQWLPENPLSPSGREAAAVVMNLPTCLAAALAAVLMALAGHRRRDRTFRGTKPG